MGDFFGAILGIALAAAFLFIGFVYLPAFLSKINNTTMRTRGIINTTYTTELFDAVNDDIKDKSKGARDFINKLALNEYERMVYEIDTALSMKSSNPIRYSDYLKLREELLQMATDKGVLPRQEEVKQALNDPSTTRAVLFDKNSPNRRFSSLLNSRNTDLSEMYQITQRLGRIEAFFKDVDIDTIIGFFSKIAPINTVEKKAAFLDCIRAENFKPLDVTIMRIYDSFRHDKFNDSQIDQLRHYILSKYIAESKQIL